MPEVEFGGKKKTRDRKHKWGFWLAKKKKNPLYPVSQFTWISKIKFKIFYGYSHSLKLGLCVLKIRNNQIVHQ